MRVAGVDSPAAEGTWWELVGLDDCSFLPHSPLLFLMLHGWMRLAVLLLLILDELLLLHSLRY